MKEEQYTNKEKTNSKIQAKVILARCSSALSKSNNLFGMRIQKFGSDWKRTWAFKIDAERAHNEGYDKENTNGTFEPTTEYPGCPYCHSFSLAQCACGKSFCYKTEGKVKSSVITLTCPWCGKSGTFQMVDRLDLQGGGF